MKNYQNKPVETVPARTNFKTAQVTEYMRPVKELITFNLDTEIMEVVNTLLGRRITGAPVLNEKKELVGLIDDKDCLQVLFDSAYHNQPVNNNNVAHFMTNVMKTISASADIYEVADTFLNTKYKRLLVVDDDGKLVGQISRRDILRAIHDFNTNAK
jgi:predicted transcriptional regulator